jgi:hypothetical protein
MYREFGFFLALVLIAILIAALPIASAAEQSTESGSLPLGAASIDDVPLLPLDSIRDLVPLYPAVPKQASPSQSYPTLPCNCEQLQRNRVRVRQSQQLRESLLLLQADKKHGIRIYMLDRSQKKGRVISVGEDSFTVMVAKGKSEITIPYKDVSWVAKEPTGGEKFGRGLGLGIALVVLAPFWLPLMLLWAASGAD